MEHLSNIELYFTPPEFVEDDKVTIDGDEFHHCVNVMRNSPGQSIFVTNGKGIIYTVKIDNIGKNSFKGRITEIRKYQTNADKVWFCLPVLRNTDRLKFAVEKCVELGIINFILFNSKHSITKTVNAEKIQKTAMAAMKQSLRSFLPNIKTARFAELIKYSGSKILFDQNAEKKFNVIPDNPDPVFFLFGPEGGFDNSEIESVSSQDHYRLSPNRLRSETAIIKCASLLNY